MTFMRPRTCLHEEVLEGLLVRVKLDFEKFKVGLWTLRFEKSDFSLRFFSVWDGCKGTGKLLHINYSNRHVIYILILSIKKTCNNIQAI